MPWNFANTTTLREINRLWTRRDTVEFFIPDYLYVLGWLSPSCMGSHWTSTLHITTGWFNVGFLCRLLCSICVGFRATARFHPARRHAQMSCWLVVWLVHKKAPSHVLWDRSFTYHIYLVVGRMTGTDSGQAKPLEDRIMAMTTDNDDNSTRLTTNSIE